MATARKPGPAKGTKPVRFSQALFDRICALIADGKSVREACSGKGMPDRGAFNDWRKRTPELQAQYDAACLDRQEATFDDIQYIADTEKDTRRAAVMIDARKWRLARMNRKEYGDKVANEHSGPNGGPIETRQQVVRLRMTPVEELPE
jgi:hypothetical protein